LHDTLSMIVNYKREQQWVHTGLAKSRYTVICRKINTILYTIHCIPSFGPLYINTIIMLFCLCTQHTVTCNMTLLCWLNVMNLSVYHPCQTVKQQTKMCFKNHLHPHYQEWNRLFFKCWFVCCLTSRCPRKIFETHCYSLPTSELIVKAVKKVQI